MEIQPPHRHTAAEDCHEPAKENLWLKRAAIGTALVAGAIILSPYILPALGVGTAELAEEAMVVMHGTGAGTGVAGAINGVIDSIPLVGSTLSQGGLITAATSGAIGLGGALLGRYIDKKDDGTSSIRWGKVISTVALATSALLALPSLLTGISVGVVYMAAAFSGVELASSAVGFLSGTLGSVSTLAAPVTGAAGAAAALPHLLTCVAPAIPGVLSLGILSNEGGQYASYLLSSSPATAANSFSDDNLTIRMEPSAPLEKGKPVTVRMTLTHNDTGKPVTPEELKVVHTEKIHLFVVDKGLRDYQHIHPQPTNEPGVYEYSFTPKTQLDYSAWADIVLSKDDIQHRIKTQMPGATQRGAAALIVPSSNVIHDGINCNWAANPPLQKNGSSMVEITLRDANGAPITDLEPIMGAYIHLVGFTPDGKTMIHTHPLEEDPVGQNDRGGPRFHFHVEPEVSGAVQFYVQVQRNGVESYIPVGQMIKPPGLQTARYLAAQQSANLNTGYASL